MPILLLVLLLFLGWGLALGLLLGVVRGRLRVKRLMVDRNSEERLQLALQSTGAAVWDWQPLTGELWVSEQFYTLTGLKAQSQIPSIETWIAQHIDPIDRDRVSLEWQAAAAQQCPTFAAEYRILHPQGTRWIADQAELFYQAGQLERVVGTLLDITARKQAEMALVKTSNILQAVIESTRDVVFIKDLQGRYALVNQAAAKWVDRPASDILGQDDYALFPQDVVEQMQAVDRQVMEQGTAITYEEQLDKRNQLRSLLTSKYPWRNGQGETIGVIGIAIDVTELKQAEVALRDSEARYRFLVENTSDMVFRVGLREPLPLDLSIEQAIDWIFREAFFAAVNDGFLRAYGYEQASDLIGQPLARLMPRTPENEALERTLVSNGHRIVEARSEEVDRQGNRKVMLNSIVGRIENGYVYDYMGTSRDITEQVQAEEALAAQEARYRYIFNAVGVSIWEEDFSVVKAAIDQLKAEGIPDFAQYFADHPEFVEWAIESVRIVDVNQAGLHLCGAQDKAELLASLHTIFLPATRSAFVAELLTLAQGDTFLQAETAIQTLQGQPIPVLFSISFPTAAANFDRVLVTVIDISDRKQAEVALAQNQLTMQQQLAEIEAIYQTAPIGLAILDRDLRFVRLNEQLAEINGLSIEAHRGRCVREIVPDIAETVEPLFQRVLDTGEPLLDLEITGETAAQPGVQRTWIENWFPLRNPQGDVIGINAVIQEISDRKRAESTLRENEERLRLALTAANQGMYDLNVQTGETIVSPEYAQLLGYDPATFVETNANWQNRLHPDDRDRTARIYQEYLAGDRPEYRVEFRQRTQAGDWKWILSLGKIIAWDAEGKPLRMLGTHTDINDRKQAETDLQERSAHIQLLYETTRDLLSTRQPLALIDSIFSKLRSLADLDLYLNYILDSSEQHLHLMFYGGISPEVAESIATIAVGEAVCGTVAQECCQIVQPNIQDSTAPKTALIRSLGLTAYSCQPLIAQGKLYGTLSFGSRSRTTFTPAETHLFQAICDQIAIALDRSALVTDLQRQTEELRQANRLKDEFLAALSHELRTPLNPILGWTQLLKRQSFSPDKASEALDIIERNVQHQLALIDDLLDVSRLIQGRLNLTFQAIDLALILTTAIGTVSFAAQAKNIAIAYQGLPSLRTLGDGDRLRQIFWNLLSNAIKFTPEGGRVEVTLEHSTLERMTVSNDELIGGEFTAETQRTQGLGTQGLGTQGLNREDVENNSALSYAQIRIADTGIGITPAFLPYVFDHFRQADGSTTRKYGGLGLGLAIVRHLVELHGGTVRVESAGNDQGSTFTVRLPIPANIDRFSRDRSSLPGIREADLIAPLITTSNPNSPLIDVRILLVDDEPDNLTLLQYLLQEEGAIVTTATSALAAIDRLTTPNSPTPQLIVSDIGMSGMDGYEFIRQVRAMPACHDIPALALSAFAQPEDQLAAIEAGYQAYLAKPVNPIQFLAALTQLLD